MFPSMTKQNMRYRGPMESEKINRFTAAEAHDAYKLTVALSAIADRIITLRASNTYLQGTMDAVQDGIDRLKGAIS